MQEGQARQRGVSRTTGEDGFNAASATSRRPLRSLQTYMPKRILTRVLLASLGTAFRGRGARLNPIRAAGRYHRGDRRRLAARAQLQIDGTTRRARPHPGQNVDRTGSKGIKRART